LLERLEIRRPPREVQEVCLKTFCAVMAIATCRWVRGWMDRGKNWQIKEDGERKDECLRWMSRSRANLFLEQVFCWCDAKQSAAVSGAFSCWVVGFPAGD